MSFKAMVQYDDGTYFTLKGAGGSVWVYRVEYGPYTFVGRFATKMRPTGRSRTFRIRTWTRIPLDVRAETLLNTGGTTKTTKVCGEA
jgi:hypothetical protein